MFFNLRQPQHINCDILFYNILTVCRDIIETETNFNSQYCIDFRVVKRQAHIYLLSKIFMGSIVIFYLMC